MHFWYQLLTYCFYPFSHIYLFLRVLRKKEHPNRYKEKLSKINLPRGNDFLLWCHVASIGEAMSILPLIEDFEKQEKIKKILITTITLSSAEVLKRKYEKNTKIFHQFLPLDVPHLVNKFLDHWSPNLSIFIDSEIWPNLIHNIKKKNIPLLLVNGRITKKTFFRWNILKKFAKRTFEKFDLCLVANEETENHLKRLGAKNIKNYGNLKYAKRKSDFKNSLDSLFLNKIKKKKIWCAASTRPSEEIFCAKTHLKVKKTHENVLTIIVPRHISRVKKIFEDLSKFNLKIVLFSNKNEFDDNTDILLIDSYGEALKLYNISKCVFLGKSLIESLKNDSGQNPIEPARLGCKIFHGPFVSNFLDVYKYLESLGSSKEIRDYEMLSQFLVEELKVDKKVDSLVIDKIENYGKNTLNNVLNEIKIYIKN